MKREDIDLHAVLPQHYAIHERLCNWARYVRDHRINPPSPMFRQYRSSEIWAPAEPTMTDPMDGHKLEKAVSALPEKHRDAIRWHYVYTQIPPHKMCRHLAVQRAGLMLLVKDGRSMLGNRLRATP